MRDLIVVWWRDLRVALIFLTRLPLRHDGEITGDDLTRALRANALAGAVVGLVGALAFWLAHGIGLGAGVAALLAVAATILVTGAFHEDGLADVADGFGGGWTVEDKLAILRDSRVGTYGGLALILTVGLRAACLAALADPAAVVCALVAAHAGPRGAIPLVMRLGAPVRRDGLGTMAGRPDDRTALVAAALGAALVLLVLGPGAGLLALAAGALAMAAMALLARRQIGGYTGDVLGAAEQLGEIAVLLAVVAAS